MKNSVSKEYVDFSKRLREYLEFNNILQADVSRLTNFNSSVVGTFVRGSRRPIFGFIQQVALNFPELNLRLLLTGNESMMRNKVVVADADKNYVKQFENLILEKERKIWELENKIAELELSVK